MDHYALLHRPPLFSHAELLCRLAESGLEGGRVPITFLLVVTDQLAGLLAKERSLRRHLVHLGVRRTERLVFEALDENARECQLCKTTLFTSALTCSCSKCKSLGDLTKLRRNGWMSHPPLILKISSLLFTNCPTENHCTF